LAGRPGVDYEEWCSEKCLEDADCSAFSMIHSYQHSHYTAQYCIIYDDDVGDAPVWRGGSGYHSNGQGARWYRHWHWNGHAVCKRGNTRRELASGKWSRGCADGTGVDLGSHFAGTCNPTYKNDVYAYSKTHIYAASSGKYTMTFGTEDGFVIWVNGKEVANEADRCGSQYCYDGDEFNYDVTLQRGRNDIVVKVGKRASDDNFGGWGFVMKFPEHENGLTATDTVNYPEMKNWHELVGTCGMYELEHSVTDCNGNSGKGTSYLWVVDTYMPEIAVELSNNNDKYDQSLGYVEGEDVDANLGWADQQYDMLSSFSKVATGNSSEGVKMVAGLGICGIAVAVVAAVRRRTSRSSYVPL
jgi:hypothetical protein